MLPNLADLLKRQSIYNYRVRAEKHGSKLEWTQKYILGIVGELDELLRALSWKAHRSQESVDPSKENIAIELADITKFVLSLWELWGFTAEDICRFVDEKSDLLELNWIEDRMEIPPGSRIIITDLDGTIFDWRRSFVSFLKEIGVYVEDDKESSLNMELDLQLGYEEYLRLKDQFESIGRYATLYPYRDAIDFLKRSAAMDRVIIIAFTARPFHKHKRIWMDTWKSVRDNGLTISQIRSGSESRILFAADLARKGHSVVVLEDNSELILRAANSGMKVIARTHEYNKGIVHENVTFVESFLDLNLWS